MQATAHTSISDTQTARRATRSYLCNYQLRNGARGQLTMLAASSCDAIIAVADCFGLRIQRLSVRPA